jgi:hypothetical protein
MLIFHHPHQKNFALANEMVERLHMTSLSKYISFARHRLTRTAMANLLPNLFPKTDHFDEDTIQLWNREMISHNAALDHGHLVQIASESERARLSFSSLNEYVRHMHADKILLALLPLVEFGERVLPLIRDDETARAWFLNEQILIQARHWRALASEVINIVTQLGFTAEVDASNSLQSNDIKLGYLGRRAVEIYGVYAANEGQNIISKKRKSPESRVCASSVGKRFCSGNEEEEAFPSQGALSHPK